MSVTSTDVKIIVVNDQVIPQEAVRVVQTSPTLSDVHSVAGKTGAVTLAVTDVVGAASTSSVSSVAANAAADATTKAANAQSAAILTASSDATTKANTAQSVAISTAAASVESRRGATNGLASLGPDGLTLNTQQRLRGRSDRSHVLVAGVIRNYDTVGDGSGSSGWELIRTFHPNINITGVDSVTDTGLIEIKYDTIAAGRTVTFIANCDETLTKAGFTVGASVSEDRARLQLFQVGPMADRVNAYNVATLSGTLSTGSAITSIPVSALSGAIKAGEFITLVDSTGPPPHRQVWAVTADAAIGATSITVASQVPNFAYPSGTNGWAYRMWKTVNGGTTEPSPFTIESVTNNHITLAHPQVQRRDRFAHVVGRIGGVGENYAPQLSTSLDTSDTQRLCIDFFDDSGTRLLWPDTKCRAVVQRGTWRTWFPPNLVNETTFPNGNIWFTGFMQVEAQD